MASYGLTIESGVTITSGITLPSFESDDYFEYTTLLLPGNGTNGATNNAFLDSSTANSGSGWGITRTGNTTQGTFSPFSQTGWGNYFNGSSSYLSGDGSSGLALSTVDFTIELWVFANSYTSQPQLISFNPVFTNGAYPLIYINSSGGLVYYVNNSTAITGGSVSTGVWHHVAVARSGTSTKMFLNGTQVGSTYSDTNNYLVGASRPNIGKAGYNDSSYLDGYISNLRVVKGTAVYTSNFTPPTTPLTAITNTQLLTCQSNRFIDTNTQIAAKTITATGSPRVVAFSPFNPTASWSAATYGGSGYFDGTGDNLTLPSNWDGVTFGTGAFSFEVWVYQLATNTDARILGASNFALDSRLFFSNYGSTGFGIATGSAWQLFTSTPIPLNQWTHVVVCRSGGTLSIFFNGVRQTTATNNNSLGLDTSYFIGGGNWYLSNLRIVKNSTAYDPTQTTLTVPTAPVTAITNTSLLLNFTNAGIYDATSKNNLETVGNAQISTTQSKWGGSSISFDGTGDYLQSPDSELVEFGSGDLTIETWVRFAALPSSGAYYALVSKWDNSTQKSYLFYVYNNSGTYQLYFTYTTNGSTNINPVATITPSINTWYHYAVSRSGANLRMFIDGTQVGSTYNIATDTIFGGTYPLQVGAATGANTLNGYMQDVRITKGYARYTANFTPPTTAFPTF